MGESACYAHLLDESGRIPDRVQIYLQRAYDLTRPSIGKRILVDRIWPRGVKREQLHLDAWPRDLAPSTELRNWFGHDPKRWEEFRQRYREELKEPGRNAELEKLAWLASQGPITLLFGARDTEHNQAVVIRAALEEMLAIPTRDNGEVDD